ncbi:uncharacterized protein [Chelonus insularis]|nr:uncharacterized protein LOC118068094 isoform X2 [Chelonus insularis]
MIKSIAKAIFGFLLILKNLEAATIVDHFANDDYFLEHEVSYEDAIAKARNLSISQDPIPGCKACTYEEMTYCKDGSVISDHCCCDSTYDRVFSFVEHVCYIGRHACKSKADNCAEYERLKKCCCYSYLSSVWKYRAGGVDAIKPNLLIFFKLLLLPYILQRIF